MGFPHSSRQSRAHRKLEASSLGQSSDALATASFGSKAKTGRVKEMLYEIGKVTTSQSVK